MVPGMWIIAPSIPRKNLLSWLPLFSCVLQCKRGSSLSDQNNILCYSFLPPPSTQDYLKEIKVSTKKQT